MLVGAPDLGRYVAFGQLFARFGIGSEGAIHRLDRHPAMVSHPVTPMQEADLLRHLAAQTKLGRALVDMIALEGDASAALDRVLEDESVGVVLFDGLTAEHLQVVGRLIDERGTAPWFSVGSSAVERPEAWVVSQSDHASTGLLADSGTGATGDTRGDATDGVAGAGGADGVGRGADNQAAASSRLATSETARMAGKRFMGRRNHCRD
ncbi:MAG: hypothetical protein J6386_24540 [Candidatus Synoicihabitans palmerolidicus]|nr:hypothetical protein [Candidatus Synoicihabitans palmerolidicus]